MNKLLYECTYKVNFNTHFFSLGGNLFFFRGEKLYTVTNGGRVLSSSNLIFKRNSLADEKYVKYGRRNCFVHGKKAYVFLAPKAGVEIISLETYESETIHFFNADKEIKITYETIIDDDDRFIIVPLSSYEIIIFNKNDYQYKVYTCWREEIDKNLRAWGLLFDRVKYQDVCICEDNLFLNVFAGKKSFVAEIDLTNMNLVDLIDLELDGDVYGLVVLSNSIWTELYTEKTKEIVKIDRKNNNIVEKWMLPDSCIERVFLYLHNSEICIALRTGQVYAINLQSGVMRKVWENSECELIDFVNNGEYIFHNGDKVIIVNVDGTINEFKMPKGIQLFLAELD